MWSYPYPVEIWEIWQPVYLQNEWDCPSNDSLRQQSQRCVFSIPRYRQLRTKSLDSNHRQCYGCGAPSNFERILDLYDQSHEAIKQDISGNTYSDVEIKNTIRTVYEKTGYLLDPHGACAYQALKDEKKPDETGVFLATAHLQNLKKP